MKKTSRFLAIVFGISLSLAVFGVPFVNAQTATTSTAQTPAITLQLGNQNVAVSALQKLLVKMGFLSVASPTGYFGPLTQSGVIAFQKKYNLPQTGMFAIPAGALSAFFADAATPFAPASVGSTGTQVKSLQQFLIKRGLLNVPTSTTYFGSLTKAALITFQNEHGLPQTGVLDQATFAAMNGQ